MKVLLTAEIDANSEAEAQEKLDNLREYLSDITTGSRFTEPSEGKSSSPPRTILVLRRTPSCFQVGAITGTFPRSSSN